MKQIANTKITRWILSSVLTFISLALGQGALAKGQDPNSRPYVNPFQTEAGAALICEDCVRIKPEVALGRDITKHISDVFGKKPQEVTTRPVDVRKKNQAFLNAVARIAVPVKDLDGVTIESSGSGTLTTDIEVEDKPCVIVTAKHVACAKQVAKKFDGSLYLQPSNDAECTDSNRTIEVKIGKTGDPKGNGFDFTARAQIIEVGSWEKNEERGDWAVLKIIGKTPKKKNFPKPIPTLFADIGQDYSDLQVVSAGYPGYGDSSKLYADWQCRSGNGNFSVARTDCEIDNGFSGGPLLANLDDFGVAQVGINTSGANSFDGHRWVQSSGDVVSFELKNSYYETDVTEGTKIREAMKKITCD